MLNMHKISKERKKINLKGLHKIEEKIRKAFLESKLEIGEAEYKKWEGIYLKSEPWTSECFTNKELKDADLSEEPEYFLEELAYGKALEIVEKENWDGVAHFYPYESGVEYGLSIFFSLSSFK